MEWLQRRARLRDERRFHLDCAAAELRDRGFTAREARRAARRRYGRQSFRAAARELGCDFAGLVDLIRRHRMPASPWLQPVALASVIIFIFLVSPQPRELANSVFIRVQRAGMPGAILTVDIGSRWFGGDITGRDFEALQSMTALTRVERYHGSYAWGQAAPGATLQAIVSEARRQTGNAKLAAEFVLPHWKLRANPAQSIWLFMVGYCAFLLFGTLRWRLWRWLLYAAGSIALHAAASLAIAACTVQIRNVMPWAITFLFIAWMGVAVMQVRYWWSDLRSRCPVCFERMVLPLTEGAEGSMILRPAVTESICTHGHGVLVESRWSRTFRPEESPIESLTNFS
jgi:hypothetical protein